MILVRSILLVMLFVTDIIVKIFHSMVSTLSFNRSRVRIRTGKACSELLVVFAVHMTRTLTCVRQQWGLRGANRLMSEAGTSLAYREKKTYSPLTFPFSIIYPFTIKYIIIQSGAAFSGGEKMLLELFHLMLDYQ